MKISERQRELLERALDAASVTITSGADAFKYAEALALIARAIAVVREVPGRRLRSDFDAKRADKAQMPLSALTPEYKAAQEALNREASSRANNL